MWRSACLRRKEPISGSWTGRGNSQITNEGGNSFPQWSPDGKRVAHRFVAPGLNEFRSSSASGTGESELILSSAQPKFPSSWSLDGRYLLYFFASPETGGDLAVLPMTGDHKPSVLLATPNFEVWPRFSPDGHWVAYTSNESSPAEVYVRPFEPGPGSGASRLGSERWQISTAGGIMPIWRRDGRELFFLGPAGEMMASTIEVNGATLTSGTPVKLFDTRVLGGGTDNAMGRQYDVSSDGRFLVNEVPEAEVSPITLIQNWNPDAGK